MISAASLFDIVLAQNVKTITINMFFLKFMVQ